MSGFVPPSLFFLQLPELKSLLSVTLSFQDDEEPRTRQIQSCRELVLMFQDVVASPALDSFTDVTVLMTTQFFHQGLIQAFAHSRQLQVNPGDQVFPGDIQRCLSYTLVTRLAPGWNKAGLYLVLGKHFLTERKRLNAISLELSTRKDQLCVSVEASAVRLPPTSMEDFDLPAQVLRRFFSDVDCVLDLGSSWCHVLPSMKKGLIVSISRRLPAGGPFRSYRDLQRHWNLMYGYELPELPEEQQVYCSVYFKPLGQKLFTYPLICVRLQPMQCCPRVDLQGVLDHFLSDVRDYLQSVCGFPTQLTSQPRHSTLSLRPASSVQVSDGELMTPTTSPSAIRPVFTQLPPHPPTRQSLFGAELPALTYQQGGAEQLADDKRFPGRLTQSEECVKDGSWPSSFHSSSFSSSFPSSFPSSSFSSTSSFPSSSFPSSASFLPLSSSSSSSCSSVYYSFSEFSVDQPAACLSSSSTSLSQPAKSHSSYCPTSSVPCLRAPLTFISTSSPSPLQSASSLSSISSLQLHRLSCPFFSSSILPPLPSRPLPLARPKLVPIFKNKHPLHHVTTAQPRVQKEKEWMRKRGEEGDVTLPLFGGRTPVASTSGASPSMLAASLSVRLPPSVPRFARRPKRPCDSLPPPDLPNVRRVSSLSPRSKFKPSDITLKRNMKVKTKLDLKTSTRTSPEKTTTKASRETQQGVSGPSAAAPPEPPPSSGAPSKDPITSREEKVVLEKKLKKTKLTVEEVENFARNKQLFMLSSSSLTAWLKMRGLPVSARLTKDELMLKVTSCLAEA